MGRQTRMTHLVQQHATLGAWSEPALNKDVTPVRLEQTVAPMGTG